MAKNLALDSVSTDEEKNFAWNQFKKFRNSINNKKRYEEALYKAEKMKEVVNSADLLWRRAKSFMGWKCQGTPNQIKVDNEIISSAKKIAHAMNNYFIDKISTIRSSMSSTSFPVLKLTNMMKNKNCRMQLNHVSINKVRHILKNLSNSRSTGVDEVDSYSLKIASDLIAEPLHHIICL